jgi:hypothetical protein
MASSAGGAGTTMNRFACFKPRYRPPEGVGHRPSPPVFMPESLFAEMQFLNLHLSFRMKNPNVFQVVIQISAFIGSQNSEGKTQQGPQMNHSVMAFIMFGHVMDLGVAVVASRNAVISPGSLDLLVFQPSVLTAFIRISGLEKTTPAAAAIIVGPVGGHVDEVLLAHHGFHHIPQVFGIRVAITFPDDLAGILDRELDFPTLVPLAGRLEFALANPFGVIMINLYNLKGMGNVEFLQSGPD